MPSVGMRRTTRVFGARVLRSGRRLFTHDEEEEVKHMRRAPPVQDAGDDWVELVDRGGGGGGDVECKENGWRNSRRENGNGTDDVMDIDDEQQQIKPNLGKSKKLDVVDHDGDDDDNIRESRRWGAVYTRKRKRTRGLKDRGPEEKSPTADKRYGKKFFRKQVRKKIKGFLGIESHNLKSAFVGKEVSCKGLVAFLEPCCSHNSSSRYWFSCFLNSVLRYMRRTRVFSWRKLSSFLLSEPMASVYPSLGIRFLPDNACNMRPGFCKIFSCSNSLPLFAVGFSSIPFCFMYIHSSMLLRSAFLSYLLVVHPVGTELVNDSITDDDDGDELPLIINEDSTSVVAEELSAIATTDTNQPLREPVVAEKPKPGRKKVARISVSKLTGKNVSSRIGVTTRSSIQKRRTSLRSKKHRNLSAFGTRKASGALVSDLFSKQDGVPFFPIKSNPEISKSIRRVNFKELKSSMVELTQDIDSACCNANILVIEPDRCYREEGAVITMKMSAPQQWFLVVKRNGLERFRLAAQNVMRPCCCNRITHAIIWAAGDDSWKLEFPNRQDWFVFKELYRKCSEQTVRAPVASIIPVPRVSEVSGYAEEEHIPYKLPDSYISSRGDELSRLLEKSDIIYEMDSDDEEWLSKFNNEHSVDGVCDKRVSEDIFERIVDAFERGIYCSPDDYSDMQSAVDRCLKLASKEILESVYSYWMAKRKKKRSALVRVFQLYQPKKNEQLSFKAVFRKKRSFKRQASQAGRGKQISFLKAIVNEQHAVEEAQNASIKVQETKAAAKRSEDSAVVKRQRAQLLMETADLMTYKAAMALRIAEERAAAESVTNTNVEFISQ